MNKDKALELLRRYLEGVLYHRSFLAELLKEIVGSGKEAKVFTILMARLLVLNAKGILATEDKEFEPITSGLYSMHISSSGFNIRILFAFLPDSRPVLLCAFYERGGKGKTNYSSHIQPALSRLEEMKEDYEHGRI